MLATRTNRMAPRNAASAYSSASPARHIEEYRLKRDEILNDVTDAAGESTKIPRLQRALQEYDDNFDVIGLINFNWGHILNKPLNIDDRYLRERRVPQSRSNIIKNKYAIRYLAGQERMCRLSGMAQRITPQLLNLRSRDQVCTKSSRLLCIGTEILWDRALFQGHQVIEK